MNETDTKVAVEQVDREAAADYCQATSDWLIDWAAIRHGDLDNTALVQGFARHRLEALNHRSSAPVGRDGVYGLDRLRDLLATAAEADGPDRVRLPSGAMLEGEGATAYIELARAALAMGDRARAVLAAAPVGRGPSGEIAQLQAMVRFAEADDDMSPEWQAGARYAFDKAIELLATSPPSEPDAPATKAPSADAEQSFTAYCANGITPPVTRVGERIRHAYMAGWADGSDALGVEGERLREAARALVSKLHQIHSNPAYQSVWTISQLHIGPYDGPTYTAELATLDAALSSGHRAGKGAGE